MNLHPLDICYIEMENYWPSLVKQQTNILIIKQSLVSNINIVFILQMIVQNQKKFVQLGKEKELPNLLIIFMLLMVIPQNSFLLSELSY